jgi:hypothetical protein
VHIPHLFGSSHRLGSRSARGSAVDARRRQSLASES